MDKARKNLHLLLCMVVSATLSLNAQISINTDGAAPDSSAMLDIKSTSKGMLVPKMTKTQRLAIAGPATGLLVYQTDEPAGFYFNAGTPVAPNWKSLLGELAGASSDKNIALNQWFGDKVQAISFPVSSTYSMVFDGQYIWVLSSGGFYRFNPANGYVDIAGTGGSQYEMMFDGRYIWSPQGNTVVKTESGNGGGAGGVAVGTNPRSLAYDGTTIWVANYGSSNVTPIVNGVAQTAVPVGNNPISVIFDGTHVWVSNSGSNSLSKIDPVTRTVIATLALPLSPKGLEFDGAHVWVTTGGSGFLYKLELSSGSIAETFSGFYTEKLMFDGTYMWFSSPYWPTNQLYKLSLNGTLLKTYSFSYAVTSTVFDGNNIWVGVNGAFLYKISKN